MSCSKKINKKGTNYLRCIIRVKYKNLNARIVNSISFQYLIKKILVLTIQENLSFLVVEVVELINIIIVVTSVVYVAKDVRYQSIFLEFVN